MSTPAETIIAAGRAGSGLRRRGGAARLTLAGAALATGLAAGPASAGPEDGKKLAEQWCSSCHLVTEDQEKALAGVPSFAEIAATREPDWIRAFLIDPHPPMPPLRLSNRQIDDILAYLRTLKEE